MTTWGRGISTYGLPDTKTWEGIGHADKTKFGRREKDVVDEEEEEEEEEQS